jgi:uncharacterized protein (TIGR03435 family)
MNFHSLLLAPIVSALANHLWQSTLFAAAAGLLALVLRKNHARVRYGLWLAASVKFLLPFSLLMAIGSHLGGLWSAPAIGANPGMYAAMDQVSQPFDQMAAWNTPGIGTAQQTEAHPQNLRLTLLMLAWLAGFLAVLGLRSTQWRGIATILHAAKPLTEGREIEMLRRMERLVGLPRQIEMRLSQESLEPGIVGVFSPVLLWPEGISGHLDDAQLEAVLAHEICHVQRRDNLTSSLHLLVEALFWIYPLVWWLEKPLIAERERACDEEVLRLGRQPQTYAESILKVCEFCVESPLTCVSGITGADLKKRIVRIMTASLGEGLSGGRKALLAAAAVVAIAVPIVLGQANGNKVGGAAAAKTGANPSFSFEVVSIRPNHSPQGSGYVGMRVPGSPGIPKDRFTATNVPTGMFIGWAFGRDVSGGPSWINSERYNIDAKLKDSEAAALEKLSGPDRLVQMKLMVQSLLADRFGLEVKYTTGTQPVYALVIAEGGPKLQETVTGSTSPINVQGHPVQFLQLHGELRVHGLAVSDLARWLWLQEGDLGRPVLDQTGLKGKYDFDLKWTPDAGTETAPSDTSGPSIFTAIQEQLGLKLESTTGPKESVVIVHIEKPSEN